jgi:hypothetical protein
VQELQGAKKLREGEDRKRLKGKGIKKEAGRNAPRLFSFESGLN